MSHSPCGDGKTRTSKSIRAVDKRPAIWYGFYAYHACGDNMSSGETRDAHSGTTAVGPPAPGTLPARRDCGGRAAFFQLNKTDNHND